MVEALSRMEEIRAQITQLSTASGSTAASATSATGTAASATAFAEALASAAGTTTGATASSGVSGQAVVDDAMQYLGVPYVFGGEDASGMDCSGLVQRVFANLGIDMPRVVPDQAKLGTEVGSLAEAQPGDLIVSADYGHIAIYAGDGMKIHAPRPGGEVEYVPVRITDAQIDTIRRIVPSTSAAATDASSQIGAALSSAGVSTSSLSSLAGLSGSSSLSALSGLTGLSGLSGLSGLGGTGASGGTDLVSAALQRLIAGGAA